MKAILRHTFLVIVAALFLSGCIFSTESQNARSVAESFWDAVQKNDMEAAKNYVTWDSAQYLKYIHNDKISAKRFETGEIKISDFTAEVATVLYGGDKGDVEIPVRTVLVRTIEDNEWRVDVQKTMGSMVSGAMSAVVDQLNGFMQEGLKGIDKALSRSIEDLGKGLEKGVEDLQKELQERDESANKGKAI